MNDKNLGTADLAAFMASEEIAGELVELPVLTRTVETAAQAVGVEPDRIVKSIMFLIEGEPVLAITCGTAYVDRRAIGKRFGVGRKRVKLASRDEVLAETGFDIGAMPPFGHRKPLKTLVDQRILQFSFVYAGGGAENTLLKINPQDIVDVTQPEILVITESRTSENGLAASRFLFSSFLVILIVMAYFFIINDRRSLSRTYNVISWLRNPAKNPQWTVQAGDKCGESPFIMPTSGFIGYVLDDSSPQISARFARILCGGRHFSRLPGELFWKFIESNGDSSAFFNRNGRWKGWI
jgi:prolyl-tRNA editing enzyme YbaK/EbsC (Cys-tRNA(Pro) deacylase)